MKYHQTKHVRRAIQYHAEVNAHPCPVCHGAGRVKGEWCVRCHATGIDPAYVVTPQVPGKRIAGQ
jgi:DnaJ-class molecular chaperone